MKFGTPEKLDSVRNRQFSKIIEAPYHCSPTDEKIKIFSIGSLPESSETIENICLEEAFEQNKACKRLVIVLLLFHDPLFHITHSFLKMQYIVSLEN